MTSPDCTIVIAAGCVEVVLFAVVLVSALLVLVSTLVVLVGLAVLLVAVVLVVVSRLLVPRRFVPTITKRVPTKSNAITTTAAIRTLFFIGLRMPAQDIAGIDTIDRNYLPVDSKAHLTVLGRVQTLG